jgi:chromate transporter
VGASFWIVLPSAGAIYALVASGRFLAAATALAGATALFLFTVYSVGEAVPSTTLVTDIRPSTLALFVAGLKGGLLTFGGAYTAIPFVRNDTVGRGWMGDAQFLDGLALSGVLPAPLVIFATFVGWICGGLPGALAITAGMFLPAFAFSLIFYERLEALAEHKGLHAFLAGVAAGVVGVIVITSVDLTRSAIERTPSSIVSSVIFLASLVILYRWRSKLSTPVVLALGAAIGATTLT